ncbi:DUF6381 family protein [Streptomyces xanthochromogenes]|uniref:DUF6381 family protein n=1 Tax=Streptomyces xanthochromogenes TaxID=67384 RepID=UPI003819C000
MNPTRELGARRQQQILSQAKELSRAASRTLDPELRRRLEAKSPPLAAAIRPGCRRQPPRPAS